MISHQSPLIVTGLAHSGTTILAEMYRALGIWEMIEPWNQRRESDWPMDYTRSELLRKHRWSRWEPQAMKCSDQLGLLRRNDWMFKDPLLPLVWQSWQTTFQSIGQFPTLVILLRGMDKVEQSWLRRGQHQRAVAGGYGLTLRELRERCFDCLDCWEGEAFLVRYEEVRRAVKRASPTALSAAMRLQIGGSPSSVDSQPEWCQRLFELFDVERDRIDHPNAGAMGI